MIDEDLAKEFIGKYIGFLRKENNRDIFSKGFLRNVKNKCLIVEFRGSIQVYSLENILSIREIDRGEVEK
jgi:hypothetical protein